jgi:hypothetical protein
VKEVIMKIIEVKADKKKKGFWVTYDNGFSEYFQNVDIEPYRLEAMENIATLDDIMSNLETQIKKTTQLLGKEKKG